MIPKIVEQKKIKLDSQFTLKVCSTVPAKTSEEARKAKTNASKNKNIFMFEKIEDI